MKENSANHQSPNPKGSDPWANTAIDDAAGGADPICSMTTALWYKLATFPRSD